MLESGACKKVGAMAQTVSSERRMPAGRGAGAIIALLSLRRCLLLGKRVWRREQRSDQLAQRSASTGVDLEPHAHARAQVLGVLVRGGCGPARGALHRPLP